MYCTFLFIIVRKKIIYWSDFVIAGFAVLTEYVSGVEIERPNRTVYLRDLVTLLLPRTV